MSRSTSLSPPEPAAALSVHLLRAALRLGPLPRWLERHPLSSVSPAARQVVWSAGRQISGNPDFGYALAERVPASGVGSLWELYLSAPNLAALYEHYASFAGLLLDHMGRSTHADERSATIRHHPPATLTIDRAEEDFRAAHHVNTWRALHQNAELSPLSVCFTYPRPASTQWHRRALGTDEVHFEQPYFELELDKPSWLAPLPTSSPARFSRLLRDACERACRLDESPLSERVEELIIAMLSQDTTAPNIARQLGVSARTLRRRLSDAGEPFRAILTRAQQRESELLQEVLRLGGSFSVGRMAQLLGFANTGSLRNARPRWTAGAART